jgi:hypothetical protein
MLVVYGDLSSIIPLHNTNMNNQNLRFFTVIMIHNGSIQATAKQK